MSTSSGDRKGFWLRVEEKPNEWRSALTPETAGALIAAGFEIHVEKNPDKKNPAQSMYSQRVFRDEEFERVGAILEPTGEWKNRDRSNLSRKVKDMPILGLKELLDETDRGEHVHIHFAHCFKGQDGWKDVIDSFKKKDSTLYDLEFLLERANIKGQQVLSRVAAFGYHAGYAGAASGLLALIARENASEKVENLSLLAHYESEKDLRDYIHGKAKEASIDLKKMKYLVVGASGRSGTGAVELLEQMGIPESQIVKWGRKQTMQEDGVTPKEGPFVDILDHDVFINCIYLETGIRLNLLDPDALKMNEGKRLQVIVDVSCDPNSANNPVSIYNEHTSFMKPTLEVTYGKNDISIIAIDHLPSMLPRDASVRYSKDLLKTLKNYPRRAIHFTWVTAEDKYKEICEKASGESFGIAQADDKKQKGSRKKRAHDNDLTGGLTRLGHGSKARKLKPSSTASQSQASQRLRTRSQTQTTENQEE